MFIQKHCAVRSSILHTVNVKKSSKHCKITGKFFRDKYHDFHCRPVTAMEEKQGEEAQVQILTQQIELLTDPVTALSIEGPVFSLHTMGT